jgi:hypothetical protein
MKTINEKNRMILRFMGVRPRMTGPDSYSWSDSPFFYCTEDTPEKVMDSVVEYAKYNTDWNWLMLVFKQITNLGIPFDEEGSDLIEICADAITDVSIIGAFEACVEFIEWYNEKKKDGK